MAVVDPAAGVVRNGVCVRITCRYDRYPHCIQARPVPTARTMPTPTAQPIEPDSATMRLPTNSPVSADSTTRMIIIELPSTCETSSGSERIVGAADPHVVVGRRHQQIPLHPGVEVEVGASQPVHGEHVREILCGGVEHAHRRDQTEQDEQQQHAQGGDAEPALELSRVAHDAEGEEPDRHQRQEDRDTGEHLALRGAARGEEAPVLRGEHRGAERALRIRQRCRVVTVRRDGPQRIRRHTRILHRRRRVRHRGGSVLVMPSISDRRFPRTDAAASVEMRARATPPADLREQR